MPLIHRVVYSQVCLLYTGWYSPVCLPMYPGSIARYASLCTRVVYTMVYIGWYMPPMVGMVGVYIGWYMPPMVGISPSVHLPICLLVYTPVYTPYVHPGYTQYTTGPLHRCQHARPV